MMSRASGRGCRGAPTVAELATDGVGTCAVLGADVLGPPVVVCWDPAKPGFYTFKTPLVYFFLLRLYIYRPISQSVTLPVKATSSSTTSPSLIPTNAA